MDKPARPATTPRRLSIVSPPYPYGSASPFRWGGGAQRRRGQKPAGRISNGEAMTPPPRSARGTSPDDWGGEFYSAGFKAAAWASRSLGRNEIAMVVQAATPASTIRS